MRQFCRTSTLFAISCGFAAAASLSGTVVDAKTGIPIADANVALISSKDPPGVAHAGYWYVRGAKSSNAIETDELGHFHFSNVSPGLYRLETTAEDYCDLETSIGDPYRFDTPFEIGKGSRLPDAMVRLDHCIEIRGRVTTPDEAPVPNVTIYLHPKDPGHEGSENTKTDALGRYEFKELWDGEYIMEAVPPIEPGDHPMALPISVRPGLLRLEYGDVLSDIDFVLQPVSAGKLTVRTSASTEIDPLDFSLDIRPILQEPTEQAKSAMVSSSKQGGFEISGLAPGQYFIEMQTRLTDRPLAGGRLVEVIAESNVSVDLAVLPVVKVAYVARHREGRQLPKDACITLDDVDRFRGPFSSLCPPSNSAEISLPADITYKVGVVPAGFYLDSVLINGQRQAASAIRLPGDAAEARMELILGTSGKILVKPATGVEVSDISASLLLFDASGVPAGSINGFFDDANHLKIDSVPPGRHRLLVYPGDTPPCDLSRLNSCAGLGDWVTVQSGKTLIVTASPKQR